MKSIKKIPQDFVERSNARGFLILIRDWGMIFGVISFSIWSENFFVYIASIILIGCMQFAISESLMHEASHGNLFKRESWNKQLEFLFSLPCLMTMKEYVPDHLDHHNYMDTEKDHLVGAYEEYGLNKEKKNMSWLWVKPIIGFGLYFFAKFNWNIRDPQSILKIILFWTPIIIIFAYFDTLDILLWYWAIPLFFIFPCFIYWSEIADHYNTKSGSRTRTDTLLNFLHHNAGYHHVHHTYPTIPWYNLPEANKVLCPENVDISTSVLETFKQIIKKQI